jgi:hypothetical protein
MTASLYSLALSPWSVCAAYSLIFTGIITLEIRRGRRAQR